MSESDKPDKQVEQFADEIDRLVDRVRSEYDLSYASVVGILFMKAQLLCLEAHDKDEEQ